LFVWGASPGSAGCFKKATQTPNAGHPISRKNANAMYGFFMSARATATGDKHQQKRHATADKILFESFLFCCLAQYPSNFF
jgi:hypothetical protein